MYEETTYKSEWILVILILIEVIDLCFPTLFPSSMINTILCMGIIGILLCRIENFNNHLKKK